MDMQQYRSVLVISESPWSTSLRQASLKSRRQSKKYLREFRTAEEFKVGDTIKVDVFENGDKVDVSGVSKG